MNIILRSYVIQIASASVSLFASSLIIIMIKRATLTTPYRRLIFGLTTADVLHSVGMVTGPFASPRDLATSPWGAGNTQTCTANGFFNVVGSIGVALYLLSLSIYFFLKLTRRVTDTDFCRKIEMKMHFLIIAFVLFFSFTALLANSFNPIPTGAVCHLARSPIGCGLYPEIVGECKPGASYTLFLIYLLNLGIIPLCLVGVTVFMIILVRKSVMTERMYTLNTDNPVQRRSRANNIFKCIFCCYFDQDQRANESDADYVLRLYRRETIIQALLYIGSFLVSNIMTVFVVIFNFAGIYNQPIAFRYITSFLYPFMGFFNILIYCRPKVQKFRFQYPEMSWIRSFFLVVKAGGEVPILSDEDQSICFGPEDQGASSELALRMRLDEDSSDREEEKT